MDAIFNFDASILLWIQEHLRFGFMTVLMKAITHLGDVGILWIALTLVMIYFRKTRRVGFSSLIAMVIGLLVTNLVIKNWVARVRPYELITGLELLISKQHDFSFPSGHATNSFACAWVMFRMMKKKYGVPALVMAILISYSRLYVAVHYPTDILGGFVIGVVSAEIAMPVVRLLRRKFPKFRQFTRPTVKRSGAARSRAKA